jgi:hypothetical protein
MSKGSKSRPFSVTAEDFSTRWDAIFSKGKSNVNNVQKETSGPDGSIEGAVSQAGGHDSSGDSQVSANHIAPQSDVTP